MSGVIGVFPLLASYILNSNRHNLTSNYFKIRFGSLLEGIKTDSPLSIYWNVWFMVKRIVTVGIIIFLYEYPLQQLQFLYLLSMSNSILIISLKPYVDLSSNILELINEEIQSIAIIAYQMLSDF